MNSTADPAAQQLERSPAEPTKPQKRLRRWLIGLLILPIVLEGGVRLLGYRPFAPGVVEIPWLDELLISHPELGYVNKPGVTVADYPTGLQVKMTIGEDFNRITSPPTEDQAPPTDEIWIFGCSFTFGQSLQDDETYAWLLQAQLPDYRVRNFGTNGYGNLQSLMQLRRELETGPPPEIAILAYADFHDARNANLRGWHKNLARSESDRRIPYAVLDDDGGIEIAYASFQTWKDWPLMRVSAFSHRMERNYCKLQDRFGPGPAISLAVVAELAELCRTNHIELVIAGIWAKGKTRDFLQECRDQGLHTIDISVDMHGVYSNEPHDRHPSPEANRVYAERLSEFLIDQGLISPRDQ